MRRFATMGAAFAVLLGGWGPAPAQAQELPPGVTDTMVDEGQQLFVGAGICFACHGQDAKGLPGVGPNLSDEEWLHSDGSFQRIVELVLRGIDAEQTKTGVIMPPKGGSTLNEQQIRAVAAYVWTLSRVEATGQQERGRP